jgi:hypothetical protein
MVNVLADKKHINCAQVKVIVEGQTSETAVCRMHSSIKLRHGLAHIPDRTDPKAKHTIIVFPLYWMM